MNTELVLENAIGYKRLGLFDQAREECEVIPEGDFYWKHAQELLVGIDLCQEQMSAAANRVTALLAKGGCGMSLIRFTALALHQSGHSQKAYETIKAHSGKSYGSGDDAYSIACYAAPAGEIDSAIKALLFNYRDSKQYWIKSCLDADLELIWVRGAAGNISLESSLALAHPTILRALDTSEAYRKEIPIDYVIKNQVPENCRDYLRINPANGFYALDRKTPAQIRGRYLAWQEDYKARTMRLARKAIALAKEVVLDHQLEWAVEKAQAGHLLGARYHVLFALAIRPQELRRFAQKLRPLGMQYLFDELLYAELFDPNFCVKLSLARTAQEEGNAELALELLDYIPANLQSLVLCLLPRANNEKKRGNLHFATRLYREVIRRWPEDPVGYYNFIGNLMEEEKWDEANQIFDQAPESYRILALSRMQRMHLDDRDADLKTNYGQTFYGQPEWDERLKIIPPGSNGMFKFGEK